jgi:hypothetical protein
MNFLKHSNAAPESFPEVPKDELPDPNEGRLIPEPVLGARRNLVIICGLAIAWSTAQFAIVNTTIVISDVSVDLKEASIPVVLAVLLIYLTTRWTLEFAMMPRQIRRWPLAQLDFRIVLFIARFSLLAVAAGALDRSLWAIVSMIICLALLVMVSVILGYVLIFFTVPVCAWARNRVGRRAGTGTIFEGIFWAGLFAVIISVSGTIALGIASYHYTPIREALWPTPPNPISLIAFVATLVLIFLSHWFLRPIRSRIFADRPNYYTERDAEGKTTIHFVTPEKEPLL